MRLSHVIATLVLLPTLAFAREEPKQRKVADPEGILEVKSAVILCVNNEFVSFASGRPFAISINKHLPEAKGSRSKLACALKEQKQLDQVVFDWFGKETPNRLNIMIGNKVPIRIAQAVIAAYAIDAKLPVHIVVVSKEEIRVVGDTHWVYIGGYTDSDPKPLKPELLRELVKPDLTQERFVELLSKK